MTYWSIFAALVLTSFIVLYIRWSNWSDVNHGRTARRNGLPFNREWSAAMQIGWLDQAADDLEKERKSR